MVDVVAATRVVVVDDVDVDVVACLVDAHVALVADAFDDVVVVVVVVVVVADDLAYVVVVANDDAPDFARVAPHVDATIVGTVAAAANVAPNDDTFVVVVMSYHWY